MKWFDKSDGIIEFGIAKINKFEKRKVKIIAGKISKAKIIIVEINKTLSYKRL